MWSHMCLVLCVPVAVLGLSGLDIKFVIEYFSYRDVKLICLLQNKDYWLQKFTKQAISQKLVVSAVNIDNNFDDVLKLDKCLQQKYSTIGVVINTKHDKFGLVMQYASQNLHLDASHKWLILNDDNGNAKNNSTPALKNHGKEEIIHSFQVLNDLNISVDADIVMATKSAHNEYQLHEIINFGKIQGGNCIIKRSGKWKLNTNSRNTSKFTTNLNEFKYYRRWDFNQLPIRMMSVVSPVPDNFDPKIMFDRNPSPGVATITRTSAIVLEVIFELHNLRFVHSLAERWIGEFTLNQTKNVVGSALYHKQQDLTPILRLLSHTFDKYDVLHPPVSSIETRYYYRIPTHGAGKYENQFLRPLSKGVWLCVVAMMFLCAAVLLISAKLEGRPSSGQYAIFSVLASFCQQFFSDISVESNTSSARKITVYVTGLSCILIYNYYTSSVVSWLLNGPPPSINSLQELLESPLELIFEDIGYTRSWLLTPTYYYNKRNEKIEDVLRKKKVFNKNKNAPLFVPLVDGINMVKAGGYAYHTEVDNANRLISKTFDQSELCELGSLQSMDKTLLYAFVQKNSPYKEFFNWSLCRLFERGIIRCIQLRTWSSSMRCQGSSPRALALGGAAPVFLLLAGGYLLAIGIMVLERILWKYREGSKTRLRGRHG